MHLFAAMLALALAAPPPVARAEELAAKKDAEGLFLQFGAVKAADYPAAEERARLAKALTLGVAASRQDPAIAVGLAEKAVLLDKTAASLTLLGEVEVDLKQRAAAAGHFDEALALEPNHVAALTGRGDLAMKEDDFTVAVDMYERAQKAGAKNAKQLERARKGLEARSRAVEDLKKTEQEIKTRVATAAKNATKDWLKQIVADDEEAYQKRRLAPDGVRRQEIANFVFTYSAGNAKTGDMFAFENKVEKLLDKTYDFVSDTLGYKRSQRTNVVLMTHAEFASRHAGTPQARAAGYWNGREIVINGGSSIDERFAQVMVHEFTHAVVADLAGHGRPPRWFNEGLAENVRLAAIGSRGKIDERERAMLRQLKKMDKLPSVSQLDGAFMSMAAGVEIAYVLSAYAAELLVDKRGYSQYVDTLREMKTSKPMQAFERNYMSVEQLDKLIAESL